jgi:hypothetical protein
MKRAKTGQSKEKTAYYHFPLGGKLTKNSIYQKISDLFKNIKKRSKRPKYKTKR